MLLIFGGCGSSPDFSPATLDTLGFVGRTVCADCHSRQDRAWAGSDHDLAMSPPDPESVLGDFNDVSFTNCGTTSRFLRDSTSYVIETLGPNGQMNRYLVKYTFGHDPLQQYLVATERGRLQAFTIAWDTRAGRWFSLYPDECFEPGDPLHWSGDALNWNRMCADCHSTNVRRGFDLTTSSYATTYSEVDVSCEACHGPGEQHVALVRTDRYSSPGESADQATYFQSTGLTLRLDPGEATLEALDRRSPHSGQIEVCAPCHSRRSIVAPDYVPGKAYLDHYEPVLLDEGLYFPDGQIKDEVFVYGSFLQSRMHAAGVQCSDCHDPHSTGLRLEGKALCSQCHEAATYDVEDHLRHPDGSPGAQCVNCHMPARTYMVIDPRRDHSFSIPRPDLTIKLGVPNACNACHQDQSAEWAAAAIELWHGPNRPSSSAQIIARGRAIDPEVEEDLIALINNSDESDIVRATAMSLLDGYSTVRSRQAAESALSDEAPLVRAAALRKLARSEDRSAVPRIEALLDDRTRLVRAEAARTLTLLAPDRYARSPNTDISRAFFSALGEYREGQMAQADQAPAHLNLAVIHERLGEWQEAEASYRAAMRIDSSFVPAHLNLAMLYEQQRQTIRGTASSDSAAVLYERALGVLQEAVQTDSSAAEARYSLGLLLAEDPDRLADAASHLTAAARLDTSNARIAYNAGLAQQRLGRTTAAEALLLRAHQLEPQHPDYIDALSILYAQTGRWDSALRFTDLAIRLRPSDPTFRQRRSYILNQR